MESSKIIPDCMSCHKDLQLDFIADVTPKVFHNNEYLKKRSNDLLSQERSLLPETQFLVEQRLQRQKNEEEILLLLQEQRLLKDRIREIRNRIDYLRYGGENTQNARAERRIFIMACPSEECRGFLSQSWKCGTCGIYACRRCRVIKNGRDDEEHKCDEDLVKTYELMDNETKPCPKCSVPIYKVSGCDLMWCTNCHTTFSWQRNEVVSVEHNHNPHFYQWQRDQNNGEAPRVPGDIPGGNCGGGGLPRIQAVKQTIRQRGECFTQVENCHRLIGHIRGVVIPRYPIRIGIQDNSDLRVKYLCKEIDDEKWERLLRSRLKKSEKDRNINQVLEMFVISLTDLFNIYMAGDIDDLEKNANELRLYVNMELSKISSRYNNSVPEITDNWYCE